jgi:hyperosmotically inducible periplasmic protein
MLNAPASAPEERAADTMGMDERDRSGAPVTPGDPGVSEADRRITREIEQALLDDASLPATAKDVKVTMKDGVVTLQGPVNSRYEKSQIAAAVQRVSGITRIDNRLDIVSVSP